MDYSTAFGVIVSTVSSFGVAALAILTAIIAVAIGLLVFRFGVKKLANVAGESNFIGSESEYPKAARDRMISAMDRSNRSQNKSFDY